MIVSIDLPVEGVQPHVLPLQSIHLFRKALRLRSQLRVALFKFRAALLQNSQLLLQLSSSSRAFLNYSLKSTDNLVLLLELTLKLLDIQACLPHFQLFLFTPLLKDAHFTAQVLNQCLHRADLRFLLLLLLLQLCDYQYLRILLVFFPEFALLLLRPQYCEIHPLLVLPLHLLLLPSQLAHLRLVSFSQLLQPILLLPAVFTQLLISLAQAPHFFLLILKL